MAAQMTAPKIVTETDKLLQSLGIPREHYTGGGMAVHSPITGEEIAKVHAATPAEAKKIVEAGHQAFRAWRDVPAPKRGELVRLLGEELREHKAALGRLVSIEVGKIESEGLGEVQEMIDICDYAVGLSRQIFGLTIATERPNHRMMETWHPLGVTGIVTAFNFPVAVWSWNAAVALVCGNACIWKPSEKTPLTAIAVTALFERAVARFTEAGNGAPANLMSLLLGDRAVGEILVDHPMVAVLSARGSTTMGKAVAP
jgi:aldehyde dehydrogenase (NAD+)